MATFTTFNQFDKRFSDFEKVGTDRSCCPLFGLVTCYNFMLTGDISQKTHENNIYTAVTNYVTMNVPKYMMFDELIEYSSLNPSNLGVTTPELITQGIVGYEHIFKFGTPQDYCILVLKNRNYIAILCKHDEKGNEIYAVRDCHENGQYNFKSFEELRKWLNKTYQFEEMTIMDGVMIPEFGNIEFFVMEEPFELVDVDPELFDDTVGENENTINTDIHIDSEVPVDSSNHTIESDYAFALALQMEDDDAINTYVDFV